MELEESRDDGGTAPEDRAFRPDIEGLRAVAVLLVVIVHVHSTYLTGGFVGVDVFFVISGFVITGLLLRERSATGNTRLVSFYARRARRIIPCAMLVIVVVLVAERIVIGASEASRIAGDAKLAALFLANYPRHINIYAPAPNPLGAYWSLAVEEQFYLVYPTLFVVIATTARHLSLRAKLGVFLAAVIVGSFSWSVVASRGAGTLTAYSSPFTHAWELALGGLLAVCAGWLKKIPSQLATVVTWVGFGGVILTALTYTIPHSGYPGYIAAAPVAAAGMIIAGGTAAPRFGVEMLLKLAPFKWLGRWSYSLYLWHYPILIIAAQHWGQASLTSNIVLALIAVALSAATYFVVENPIRHSRVLTSSPRASLALGVGVIAGGLAIAAFAF